MYQESPISAPELRTFVRKLFVTVGVPAGDAALVADSLIAADARGVYSHGCTRISSYIRRIEEGGCNPQATFRVIGESSATALVDGRSGLGQVTASKAMAIAIDKAATAGMAWVTVKGGGHFGAAGYYAMMALDQDMIGLAMTNASPAIAPWGGTSPLLGNNPWAIAVPSAGEPPSVVLDLANSVVARGRIRLAAAAGTRIPTAWALDEGGKPTSDPGSALKGSLAPMGEYKGYGIAMMVDLLTGVLADAAHGAHVGSLADFARPQNVGQTFAAIDLKSFGSPDEFRARVATVVAEAKHGPRTEGVDEIFVPGEIEYRTEQRQLREGISLPRSILADLRGLATRLNVDLPETWSEQGS